MYRIRTHLLAILITFGGLLPLLALDRPNILWLSAEDHGPHLGCYGDTYADTPNLDAFAKSSLLYKNAISTAPVCAPARTTIICGMYAPSLGAHHMRSEAAKPEWLKFYPQYLREAGYYCTNNSKTDYNIQHNIRDIWDESSRKAHYDKRKKGQPFFAIFNQTCTHESQIRSRNSKTKHDPSKAPVPPYHPDVPAVRDNWAQYYDRLSQMDEWFGAHLRALREKGLADNTIVIFWADHGSGMPRGKRYAGWSGLHVPMIMHIPEKWKHLRPPEYNSGHTSNRLVGFVDLGATMLSLAGIQPPAFLQGRPFAGKHVTAKPTHSFGFRGRMDERPDCSRTVTDGRFVYIRNFMPHLPHGQVLHYQMETQSTRIWRRLHMQGKLNKVQSAFWERKAPEELYDISKDPHETRNLAKD
ncbi:MAG: sulfatase, partial [Roseibacillus sp.]|nr:sulfatase [Roseibacillus sp.]